MENFAFTNTMLPQERSQLLQRELLSSQPPSIINFQQQQQQHEVPHIMPTPPSTSWNLSTMPWNLASPQMQPGTVMQFSAPIADRKWQLHQKRKSDTTMEIPSKQFISEEKITAHFNGLHISSDYIQSNNSATAPTLSAAGCSGVGGNVDSMTTTGKCFTNLTYQDYQVTAKELEQKLLNANRITLCEEIKKLTDDERKVSFLPEALMNRVAKPCTALVLWQPPPMFEMIKQKESVTMRNNAQQLLQNANAMTTNKTDNDAGDGEKIEADVDADIDDFLDNNNTCSVDFNSIKPDSMDEDL